MADRVVDVMRSAIRAALYYGGGGGLAGTAIGPLPGRGLVSWRHEITSITPGETQIKVWPEEGRPPRYFTVKVTENL